MSYILDAIQQAEKTRKLGDLPSVSRQDAVPVPPAQARQLFMPWILAANVVLLALLVLFHWHKNEATTVSQTERVVLQLEDFNLPVDEDMPIQSVDSRATDRKAEPVPVELHSTVNTQRSLTQAQYEEIRQPEITAYQEKSQPVVSARQVTTTAPIYSEPQIQSPKVEPLPISADNSVAELSKIQAEKAEARTEHSGVASFTALALPNDVALFSELPKQERDRIPDMVISVHLFNEDPARRKIRINGRMFTEQDWVTREVRLLEITRLGAIMEHQQRRFAIHIR